jgi:Big-like domain-containing protein
MIQGKSVRERATMAALFAAATVLGVACWRGGDSSTTDPGDPGDPEVESVQQAVTAPAIGGLEGTVRASYAANGTRTQPLRGINVWAQNVVDMSLSPVVTSDYAGHYYVPRPAGTYKICWSSPGFTSSCTASSYVVGTKEVEVGLSSVAVATTKVLFGKVKLTDGTLCLNIDSFFAVKQSALVEMLSTSGGVLKRVEPNTQGRFVIPWDTTATQVRVTCGALVQTTTLGTQMDSTGGTAYQVTMANARPRIDPLTATAGGVDARQGVAPGTAVSLAAVATDPNGNPLTYHWKSSSGTLPDTVASTATWTVPSNPGTYSAYVSVNDNRGGFMTRKVEVTVRATATVLFSGAVHDRLHHGILGATIRFGSLSATSDARGNFSLYVPQSTSYLMSIEKEGYAEYSRRSTQLTSGREFILSDAYKVAINPTVSNVIIDQRPAWLSFTTAYQRRGGKVTLPANSLNLSPAPVGQLYAYITTFDPISEDMPGDMGAVDSASASVYLVTHGAVFIEIRDSVGTKYNLATGKTATVDIPIQDPILLNDPAVAASIASWTFDVPSGNWLQLAGGGTKVTDHYTMTVSHFSTKNADLEKLTPACLKVNFDGFAKPPLNAFINLEVAPNAPRRREFPLDKDSNVLYNLPPNTPYTLQVFTVDDVLLTPLTGTTGAAWGGTGIPPVTTTTCTTLTLTPTNLGFSGAVGGASTRFLSRKGDLGPDATEAYYAQIDPLTKRGNLIDFFSANGFAADGSGGTRAYYINNGDLGFGRDMHCKRGTADPLNVACYVSNYGGPDQNPGNFTEAKEANKPDAGKTVAMEYSPIEGDATGDRVVKFYIFDGACLPGIPGCTAVQFPKRSDDADLDGSGGKTAPGLCLNCHGGTYSPVNVLAPTLAEVKLNSSFLAFDVSSFRDDEAGPSDLDPAFGTQHITDQQQAFYDLNQLVLATNPSLPIQELINISYPVGITFDNTAVPCGWRSVISPGTCPSAFGAGTASMGKTEDLYHNVVAPVCRTCHTALSADKAFDSYATFSNKHGGVGAGEESGYYIGGLACTSGEMPHSSLTFSNFWRSKLPRGPGALQSFQLGATPGAPQWVQFPSCTAP